MRPELEQGAGAVPLVLGTRVDPTSYGEATEWVLEWARRGESRNVCVATVHSVMEAWRMAEDGLSYGERRMRGRRAAAALLGLGVVGCSSVGKFG